MQLMNRTIKISTPLLLLALIAGVASAQTLPLPNSPEDATLDWMSGGAAVELPHGHVMIEGDMAMPEEVLHSRATYGGYNVRTWNGGVVPYTFAASVNSTQRAQVRAAMDLWESVSGVTFVPRSGQHDYIEIIPDAGNWSYVGRIGGKQQIGLANWGYKFVVAHELAHALGFLHEQSRPDRDQYVTIHLENVIGGFEHNFNVSPSSNTSGSYDFCSVMHYGRYFFSKNSQPTISAKPGYEQHNSCMGNQTSLTAKDIEGMNALYPDGPPPTPGDTPKNAVKIPLDAQFTFSENSTVFTAAGSDPAAACANGTVSNTVWFTVKPLYDHLLTMNAGGYNTVLAVYTGSPGSFSSQACTDATGGGESLSLPMEAGVKYYVMIGSVNGSTGTLSVSNVQYRNLASNGGFDADSTGWKVASQPTGRLDDKRKCGGSGAFNSRCAIQFKGGSGENSVLSTKLTPANTAWNFAATNQYRFSMDVRNTAAGGDVSVKLIVVYTNGTKQNADLSVSGITNGYQTLSTDVALSGAAVKNIKIKIAVRTTSGKSLIDNVVFRPQQSGLGLRDAQSMPAAEKVLPVPPAN
jgi:hypothetical protein